MDRFDSGMALEEKDICRVFLWLRLGPHVVRALSQIWKIASNGGEAVLKTVPVVKGWGFDSSIFLSGLVAQLVEHLSCTQEVAGAIPVGST